MGKSTFYRYYHDIYDVFDELTESFAERVLNVMLQLVFSKTEKTYKGYKNKLEFEKAMGLFGLEQSDMILVDYLFKIRNMKTFHMVVDRFREIVRSYSKNAGIDAEQADYYTKFVVNGMLYSSLEDYRYSRLINMELVELLRSFSIEEKAKRSADDGNDK